MCESTKSNVQVLWKCITDHAFFNNLNQKVNNPKWTLDDH